MTKAPIPLNEEMRLQELRSLDILDTPYEDEFDDVVKLASHICGVPISLISLLEADRQWFKAKVGIAAVETPLRRFMRNFFSSKIATVGFVMLAVIVLAAVFAPWARAARQRFRPAWRPAASRHADSLR